MTMRNFGKIFFTALMMTAAPFGWLGAQTFSSASEQARLDLGTALNELSETRDAIVEEKVPLLREVSVLENQVRQKTDALNQLRRQRDNRDLSLNRLREQVAATRAQSEYASGLLDEFVRSFETRVDFSEVQLYADIAQEARLAQDDTNLSEADRFARQMEVVAVALDRLEKLIGGYTFEGRALAPSGTIETGTFAAFGPSVFFASGESDLAGITFNKLNAAEAAVAVPGAGYSSGIRSLIETGGGTLPIDATLGRALQIAESRDSFFEHLAKGGSVGTVIIALGLICLLLAAFKFVEVTSFKTPAPESVQAIVSQIKKGDLVKAREIAAGIPGQGGALLQKGVEHADERRGNLEEILYEKILAARPRLERLLPFIALTAAAAPLLGLLGTVTGMIKTFNLITIFGTGDAKSLSSGISEALVTTELGLIVAIPALIIHGLLARTARQKIGELEQTAVGFINGVIEARHED
ncbi:MAG: MotA/TolQ/ExbB proton channel family protein [Puniceicoccaceae bacterium]|nr:MAG: MotA/TolQ/ExbB proton channel family protein [Puniceicoccaceae bacterium]